MGVIETLTLAMGTAWTSGINLYATVAALGLAVPMTGIIGGVGSIAATPDSMTVSAIKETYDSATMIIVMAEEDRIVIAIVIFIAIVDFEAKTSTTTPTAVVMVDTTMGKASKDGFTQTRQGGIATGIARSNMRRPYNYRGELWV